MSLPALIASATLAYSVVFPNGKFDPSALYPTRSSHTVVPANNSQSGGFIYGLLLGSCLSSWIGFELQRRRVLEKCRVSFFSWLYDNEGDEENPTERLLDKFRTPTNLTSIAGTAILTSSGGNDSDEPPESCGERVELVSSDWAWTSTLSVTVLTLKSGSELIPQVTNGVEFYYVIKGGGDFRRNEKLMTLAAGSTLIVDPGSVRGFTSRGPGDLTLLRATDRVTGGDATVRLESSSMSSTAALLKAGLRKMETMVQAYTRQQQSNITNSVAVAKADDWTTVDGKETSK